LLLADPARDIFLVGDDTSRSSELAHTAAIFVSEVAGEATVLLPPGGRGLLYSG